MSRHEDPPTNLTDNPRLLELVEARLSRRSLLRGSLGAGALAFLGGGGSLLSACGDDYRPHLPGRPTKLGFSAVPKNLADTVTVPEGYTAHVLYATGDPLDHDLPEYANDGSDATAGFARRSGDHHDGMAFFGLDEQGRPGDSLDRGLLCINHEYISTMFTHPAGATVENGVRTNPDEVLREQYLYGVSVVEVRRTSEGSWSYQKGSPYNRRIHAITEMELSGPLRGSQAMITRYSPDGTRTRGTVQNCSAGKTPWGTYLTCEENWAGQFRRVSTEDDSKRSTAERAALQRYGVLGTGRHLWATTTPDTEDQLFGRWQAEVRGDTAADDYRNVANTFGWIVEIDPYAPASVPRKRTAMGRFQRESATAAAAVPGRPIVIYSGDDAYNEYIYKYVSRQVWDPADATADDRLAIGNKYLDDGTVYVARFFSDGTGEWLELAHGKNGIGAGYPRYPFADQLDVALHTRLAADAAGATKMDRPEWAAVDPLTGAVYVTLTGSLFGARSLVGVTPANPRYYNDPRGPTGSAQWGNPNGHIIRWREPSPEATTFTWDLFLFGAMARDAGPANLSRLDESNDFSSPDGLWFSPTTKVCWLQTDDQAAPDVSNCMMLACLPGSVGDGRRVVIENTDDKGNRKRVTSPVGLSPGPTLRRFLVGPVGCEITGVAEAPDGTALFVNIQHPGETTSDLSAPTSNWPSGVPGTRPRSATVVITRDDGGPIGL